MESVSENHYPGSSPKKPEKYSCTVEWEFIDIRRLLNKRTVLILMESGTS
jgi:hypothetical protein